MRSSEKNTNERSGERLNLRNTRLGIVLALLLLGCTEAAACGWWDCGNRAYGYRQPTRAYGYRSTTRVYGYIYAARPSTSIRPSRWYLRTAIPVPDAGAVGLTAPIATADGLMEGGLPGKGPTLFGPSATTQGYYYTSPAWQRRRRR